MGGTACEGEHCSAGLFLQIPPPTFAALLWSAGSRSVKAPSPPSCSLCDSTSGSRRRNITGRACSGDISNPEHLLHPPPRLFLVSLHGSKTSWGISVSFSRVLIYSTSHGDSTLQFIDSTVTCLILCKPPSFPAKEETNARKVKSTARGYPVGLWQSRDLNPRLPGSQASPFIQSHLNAHRNEVRPPFLSAFRLALGTR